MARPVHYPHGAWPLEMRAETAAGFVDEPSVDAFRAKVERGIYPLPISSPGMLPKWSRVQLEAAVARRYGLADERVYSPENIEDLI